MVTMGYKEPVFIPSLLAQAIVASVAHTNLHSFIIEFDILAFSKDIPSLLLTASIYHWFSILQLFLKDSQLGMGKVKALANMLQDLENLNRANLQ